jgi:hypothetical protein
MLQKNNKRSIKRGDGSFVHGSRLLAGFLEGEDGLGLEDREQVIRLDVGFELIPLFGGDPPLLLFGKELEGSPPDPITEKIRTEKSLQEGSYAASRELPRERATDNEQSRTDQATRRPARSGWPG